MKRFLLIALICSVVLSACRLGQMFEPIVTPTSTSTAASLRTPLPAATNTPMPPTETSVPPTATPLPVQVEGLHKIQMIDEMNGWAWETKPDHTSTLLRTADGGQTWADVTPTNVPNPSEAFFLDAQTAWVQTYDSATYATLLGLTTDGGKDWVVVNQSLPFLGSIFHFYNKMDGWAERDDVGAGQAAIRFYETHDGGASWNQVMLIDPAQDDGQGILYLCSICGDTVYYAPARLIIIAGDMANQPAGKVRLSISTDLGKSWKKISLPLPSAKYASDGLVKPGNPTFFDDRAGLLPIMIVKLNPGGSTDYRVLSVYSTQDGGMTWTPNSTVIDNVEFEAQVDSVSPNDAFVACGKNLCVTHDGTKSWQTLASNLNFSWADTTESVLQIDFVSPTAGWAITTVGNNYSLWKTTDGGQSWSNLSPSLLPLTGENR